MAAQNFEGTFWHVKVIFSNRFDPRIEFTNQGGDGYFLVPKTRIETIKRLESGEDPDIVAQSFPIE